MVGATDRVTPMSEFKTIFRNYSAAICRDQLAEKLRRALEPFCFDGTECHGVINAELRGPENEIAASNIRHVKVSQYRDTVPLDAVIEIALKFAEDEGANGAPNSRIHVSSGPDAVSPATGAKEAPVS
jgi:hypothetical protein